MFMYLYWTFGLFLVFGIYKWRCYKPSYTSLCEQMLSFLLSKYLKVELLDIYKLYVSLFKKLSKYFAMWFYHFLFHNVWEFQLLQILTST